MFQGINDKIGTWAAIASAALTLAGCSRGTPEPEKNIPSLTNSTLSALPKVAPDQRIIAVLRDQKIPAEVRQALTNTNVHETLHRIATSSENPESYVRNAPYASRECVVVLQHLLNVGREAAVAELLNHAKGLERVGKKADWMKRYANKAPAALNLDGDYGPASHRLRGFFTMVKNIVSGLTFPHTKVDTGANDTAIGPLTLNALFQHEPGIGYILQANPATYKASLDELARSSATTNTVGKVSGKPAAR